MTIKSNVRINEQSEMVRVCRRGRDSTAVVQFKRYQHKEYYYRLRKAREAFCEDTHDIVQIKYADRIEHFGRLS